MLNSFCFIIIIRKLDFRPRFSFGYFLYCSLIHSSLNDFYFISVTYFLSDSFVYGITFSIANK